MKSSFENRLHRFLVNELDSQFQHLWRATPENSLPEGYPPKFVHELDVDAGGCPEGNSDAYVILAARQRQDVLDESSPDPATAGEDRLARALLLSIDRLLTEAVEVERLLLSQIKDQL